MTEKKHWAQRGVGWVMLVVGVLLLPIGGFLVISGVGSAFGIPVLIVAVALVWVGWSGRPKST
jgi:uncharacterized membrane protein